MQKKWLIKETPEADSIRYLAGSLNISETIARILAQRNIIDVAQAKLFLNPNINNLRPPNLIPGLSAAHKRIEQALRNNENILIYGDYDVDGVTSVALFKRFFRLLGREVDFYIPHRLIEGYGISKEALDEIAWKKVNLIITVDCGISNVEEIAYAKQLGMDVIVTDHHEIPDKLPDCIIVNPKLDPKNPDSYFLSGVGVAFKVVWSLMDTFSQAKKDSRLFHEFVMDTMALVAMGTVADVVPMTGENRVLCSYGLEALQHTKIEGVRALIKQTGLTKGTIRAEDISFRLGPRLNAAGRMGDSLSSFKLLTSYSSEEIEQLVAKLELNNKERQKIEGKITAEASRIVRETYDLDSNYCIVLANDKWHSGVLGIVASKLAEEFYRPAILISTENGVGKGSGRSIPCFHLYDALCTCRELLLSVGGHEYAAGLQIEHRHIPELTAKLNEYAKHHLKTEDRTPSISIDTVLDFSDINRKLLSEIKMIAPFGEGNEEPVFCSHNLQVAGTPKLIGSTLKHLTFHVKGKNRTYRVIAYNKSSYISFLDQNKNKPFSLAYVLKLNVWQGQESIELEFVDIKASG
ncbi:MAG: single-stranded-DNA-specific exonuclease RecJ [Planctomycetes bacterium]|nr:single-stranded-DNA-specific exonuclease RecJ [Planctomycetota bacterium]